MIAFQCPKCQATLKAAEDKIGARTECPKCRCPVQVPVPMPTECVVEVLPADSPAPRRPAMKRDEVLDVLPADDVPTLEEVKAPQQRRRETRRIIARGQTGEVELLKNTVAIRRKGFMGFMVHGGGDKEILLSFISGIEFRDVGTGITKHRPGYIRFLYLGGNQALGQVQGTGGLFNAVQKGDALWKDENT